MSLAAAFFVASCVDSGETINSRGLTVASAGDSDTQSAETVTRGDALHPPTANPFPTTEGSNAPDSTAVETTAAPASAAGRLSASGTPRSGRRVSLRPKNNVDAGDLLDHWGHRRNELLSEQLSQASEPNDDVADFEDLLEDARKKGADAAVPGLREDDTVTVLGRRRGVAYGRWENLNGLRAVKARSRIRRMGGKRRRRTRRDQAAAAFERGTGGDTTEDGVSGAGDAKGYRRSRNRGDRRLRRGTGPAAAVSAASRRANGVRSARHPRGGARDRSGIDAQRR